MKLLDAFRQGAGTWLTAGVTRAGRWCIVLNTDTFSVEPQASRRAPGGRHTQTAKGLA